MTKDDMDVLDESEEDYDPEELHEMPASGLAGFLVGLAIGAVLGAGVTLLTTPERGKTVRRRIQRRLRDAGEEARDRAEGWRDDATRRLARQRRHLRRRFRDRR